MGASQACCLQSPAVVVVWVDVEIVVKDRVRPDVEAWAAGIDAIVRGEGNRAIWCVGFGRP